MLTSDERRDQILHTLQQHGNVRVERLARRFGVSAVTIRTDLRALTAAGLLTREHGGARLSRAAPPEVSLAEKRGLYRERKQKIALRALELVEPGDKLILDAGSTTLHLARRLRGRGALTVFTNSLPIAAELADAETIDLIVAGGMLRRPSQSLQGPQAEASLDAFVFDKLFLGMDGCDPEFGISTHDAAEARLNARMVERARRVIVLADGSKFGRICLHRICELGDVDTIVTDDSLPLPMRESLLASGVELIIAEDDSGYDSGYNSEGDSAPEL